MASEKTNETKRCKYCQTEIPKKAKICPNCKKKQGGIFKWIVVAVVVFVIISAAVGGEESDDAQKASNSPASAEQSTQSKKEEPQKEPEKEIVYTQYTVTQMMDDLNANALKAETTYKDQHVEITGRLDNVDSSGKYISLYPEDDEWAFIGVQCNIKNDEQKQKVMEMSTGDIVTLKGKVISVGEVLGYTLDIEEIN